MKTLASDSYNIAWFKLADFVARGEKERALSVLRLLMHSVSDEALTYQLEGDILLAFNDDSAINRYQAAANLYQKNGKFQQAICIYQRAFMLKQEETTLQALLQIYLIINHKNGIAHSFTQLATLLIEKKNSQELILQTNNISEKLDIRLQTILYSQLIKSLLWHDEKNNNITDLMYKTIDLFKQDLITNHTASSDLQKFLTDVKAINIKEYKKAETYLKESA